MNRQDLARLLAIARQAGVAVLRWYGEDVATSAKADSSPLTQADLDSNEVITQALSAWTTEVPIVSEETPFEGSWPERHWLVDPLDGTKEFLGRHGDFTVNIALVEGGFPTAGVVYAPAIDTGYAASQELGAFQTAGDGNWLKIDAKSSPSETVVVAVSRSHLDERTTDVVSKLSAVYGDVQTAPSGSSLKLVHIGEGRSDVYLRYGPTSKWDTAAGQAVAEGGGATVLDLVTGERMCCDTSGVLNNPFAVVSPWMMDDWERLAPLLMTKV